MSDAIGYHAHVYFDPATRPVAERIRNAIAGKFTVELGGFSDEPRGPHPISQFNVIFQAAEFQSIVPWLMFNREGLDVLVHPLTEDMVDDHTDLRPVAWHANRVETRYAAAQELSARVAADRRGSFGLTTSVRTISFRELCLPAQ